MHRAALLHLYARPILAAIWYSPSPVRLAARLPLDPRPEDMLMICTQMAAIHVSSLTSAALSIRCTDRRGMTCAALADQVPMHRTHDFLMLAHNKHRHREMQETASMA